MLNKTRKTTTGRLNAVILCMLALLLPALNSCKKESINNADLLATVPSSSSVVMGINLESLLKKSGCKVDGSEITPGDEVKALLAKASIQTSKDGEIARVLLNGESGVDPVGAIYFRDAYNSYVTLAVADTDKFKSFIEKETGETFSDSGNDVQVCGNVAIKGAQAWIAEGTVIDSRAVANYSVLESGQSFMAKDFADKLSNMTSDIIGWGEIGKLVGGNLSFGDRSTLNMALGMLFDDAQSLFFSVDMLKGEAKSSVSVLNKDGKPAKYLLPSDKLDMETMKSVAYKANAIVGVCVTKDLVKKIGNILNTFGGSQMEKMSGALKSVDGTLGLAFSNISMPDEAFRGVVTTDGKAGLDLMQLISSIAPITKDGKLVRFSKGEVDGALEVKTDAELLKNATMGMVLNLQSPGLAEKEDNEYQTLVVALVPDNGSVKCDVTIKAIDQSRNIMLPIIEGLSK